MSNTCSLCHSDRIAEWFKIDPEPFYCSDNRERDVYTIVKCEVCGLVFVSEEVTSEELADIYAEGYYTGRDKRGYQGYGKECAQRSAWSRIMERPSRVVSFLRRPNRLRRMGRVVNSILGRTKPNSVTRAECIAPYMQETRRLLDVGCATGIFLVEARRQGWDVTGVELSDYASEFARTEYQINVHSGTLGENIEKGNIQSDSFDLVTMWDVVEHLSDPASVFRQVHSVLKPNGLLFLETLNIDSIVAKEQGTNWHFIRPPKHLTYYSESTLKRFLDEAGFDLIMDADFREDIVMVGASKRASNSDA